MWRREMTFPYASKHSERYLASGVKIADMPLHPLGIERAVVGT
jgi:hypothetical protein